MNGFNWLDSLVNHENRMPTKYAGEGGFSTERYIHLLERLDNPQECGVPTIQILGTNGKGSTLAFLETLLVLAGRRVHSFISPHLVHIEERFRDSGKSIETEILNDYLELLSETGSNLRGLTFFEALNAAFWLWTRDQKPDFALLETGLGGRLDTTTICHPTLKILTHLDRDHAKLLGPTMDRIAEEKCVALPPDVPAVIGSQSEYLQEDISSYLKKSGVPAFWTDGEIRKEITDRSRRGWRVRAGRTKDEAKEFGLGLLGDHQVENFSNALLAFTLLGVGLPDQTEPISVHPEWRGRCEILEASDGTSWVIDGSHTAVAGQALKKVLDEVFPEGKARRFNLVSSADRNPWCYLRGLVRREDSIRLVEWKHPRVWGANDLRETLIADGWATFNMPELEVVKANVVFERKDPTDVVEIICGSLYWAGEGIRRLEPFT